MISRVESYTEKERGVKDLWLRTTSIPHIIEMDENLNVVDTYPLETIGEFIRIEDFRLFTHNDKLYSNHIIVDESKRIYPVISEIDLINKKMTIIGTIELEIPKNDF